MQARYSTPKLIKREEYYRQPRKPLVNPRCDMILVLGVPAPLAARAKQFLM
jgi:hypothetical protein